MNSLRSKTGAQSALQKIKNQRRLTDPAGLLLLLGATVAMMAVALFKAQTASSKNPLGEVLPR